MTIRFAAPWSTPLSLASALVFGILALMVGIGATAGAFVVIAVLAAAAYYTVRGYAVEPGALVIDRLGWQTRLDLDGLESAEVDPDAMRGSIRTWGFGGPFAFVGRFRSRELGPYTAYATDRDLAVVLRWPDRTVVVTPDDPEAFAAAAEAASEASEL
ncbi:MAG: PH domain-containing protein [Bacteroidota bacterium]